MATPIQELVDKRVKLINDARAFLAECEKDHGGLTEEEDSRWEAMHADADKLRAEIDAAEQSEKQRADRLARQEAAERELEQIQSSGDLQKLRNSQGNWRRDDGKPVDRLEAVNNVLKTWGEHGPMAPHMNADFTAHMKASGLQWERGGGIFIPLSAQAPKSLTELRAAQSIGTATEGGHTTFPGFSQALETAMLQFGGMRQVATILRTSTGSSFDWPTMDDTSNTGALLSENVQDAEQDLTFGNVTLDAYKYTSKIVRVSVELMQDSAFNMAQVVGSALGERLGRIQNTHATTGTGSSQPNGIVTAATLGKTAASATAITMDELLDLRDSVNQAYRTNATWMFNDATLTYIRKLKGDNNNYHWQPAVTAGAPDRLFNAPYVTNDDMATITNSAKTVLFGDLSKYLFREVMGISLIRMNERYADSHQVGFVAITRFDGDLLDAGTNPVKYLQQLA